MWMNINQVFCNTLSMATWANLPGHGWVQLSRRSTDGVTNTFLLLALAKATNKQAHVSLDSSNQINAVYL
jgi:hypothetical protein